MKRSVINLVAAAIVVAGGGHLSAQADAAPAAPGYYVWCEGAPGTSNCICYLGNGSGGYCYGTACEAGWDWCNWWVY